MRSFRPVGVAAVLLLPLLLMPQLMIEAHAGDHNHHYLVSQDPRIGYAVAIQHVYQFPAAFVYQPTSPYGYTVPIQRVDQFPAAFVFQPGPEPPFGGVMNSAYDQWAGPSFIPR
jgi:hypothetical protein